MDNLSATRGKPGGWQIQFSLATLLLAMTVLAISCVIGNHFYAEWRIRYAPIPWQTYSPELMQRLAKRNEPTLLYFTADWSPTPHVLKAVVLETPKVRQAVYRQHANALLVDCTTGSTEVKKTMNDFGVVSIPTIVIIRSGQRPYVREGNFTQATIIRALEQRSELR